MQTRAFVYDGREFPDPDPTASVEEVKKRLADFFPELSTATVKEIKDEKDPERTIYAFQRVTGTKSTKDKDGAMDGHATMNEEPPKWQMPDWMEKYRSSFTNTGGNSIEDLMNDHQTTVQVNAPRAVICCCVIAQVDLLGNLKQRSLLSREVI